MGKNMHTLSGHTYNISCVTFHPDGKKIATAFNEAILWDAIKTEDSIRTLWGHTFDVWGIAFSPNGKQIATASDDDNTAKIWDAITGEHILTLLGHSDQINGVAFSPNGKQIATASDDNTAKIWDAITGEHILTLLGHTAEVRSIAFSPDGKRIATASWDNTAKIWEISQDGISASTKEGKRLVGVISSIWQPTDAAISIEYDDRRLAGLTLSQLFAYGLDPLLEQQPDNEKKLLATEDVWQIAAFGDLYANKIKLTGFPKKEDYERALRLYEYCIESGEAPEYFAQRVEELKKVWKEKTD